MFCFKRIHPEAKVPERVGGYGAAGYDLSSVEHKVVDPGQTILVPTGLQITDFSEGWVGFIKERSGLALKHSIRIGAGVIDPAYRGPVGIVFQNLGSKPFEISVGDRIAQIVFLRTSHEDFKVLESDEYVEPSMTKVGFGGSGMGGCGH